MGIRGINIIEEGNDIVKKIVKESKQMYINEKFAYNLLDKNIPKIIRFDDKNNSIIMEKLNGKTLNEIELNEKIVIKLANAIKLMHSHTKNGKVFVHGDLHKDNIIYYNNDIYFIDFSCCRYDIPEVDYSALEIHILKDKKLLKLFYKTLNVNPDIQLLKKQKYNIV